MMLLHDHDSVKEAKEDGARIWRQTLSWTRRLYFFQIHDVYPPIALAFVSTLATLENPHLKLVDPIHSWEIRKKWLCIDFSIEMTYLDQNVHETTPPPDTSHWSERFKWSREPVISGSHTIQCHFGGRRLCCFRSSAVSTNFNWKRWFQKIFFYFQAITLIDSLKQMIPIHTAQEGPLG